MLCLDTQGGRFHLAIYEALAAPQISRSSQLRLAGDLQISFPSIPTSRCEMFSLEGARWSIMFVRCFFASCLAFGRPERQPLQLLSSFLS